jgi:hypothetical protein
MHMTCSIFSSLHGGNSGIMANNQGPLAGKQMAAEQGVSFENWMVRALEATALRTISTQLDIAISRRSSCSMANLLWPSAQTRQTGRSIGAAGRSVYSQCL